MFILFCFITSLIGLRVAAGTVMSQDKDMPMFIVFFVISAIITAKLGGKSAEN